MCLLVCLALFSIDSITDILSNRFIFDNQDSKCPTLYIDIALDRNNAPPLDAAIICIKWSPTGAFDIKSDKFVNTLFLNNNDAVGQNSPPPKMTSLTSNTLLLFE